MLKRAIRTISIAAVVCAVALPAQAQLNVLTVDCTPFVSPNPGTSFGPDNTMGMALQQVDPAFVLFTVTEVTPQAFRALNAAQLAAYDLIAINNNPLRLSDNCDGLAPGGLGNTWHSVIGINSGGRVFLCSHDAPRFKMIVPPGATAFGAPAGPCPNCEPFGSDDLVKQAALWAGGGTRTGLLIFNDSVGFVPGNGWNNTELSLPAAWNITDANQTGGAFTDGGYTDILPVYQPHPIYAGLPDGRLLPNSIGNFAANIGDTSYHSVFATYEASIFTPTELVINAGVIDVGNFNATFGFGSNGTVVGPDGLAISLIRDEASGVPSTTQLGLIALAVLLFATLSLVVLRKRPRTA